MDFFGVDLVSLVRTGGYIVLFAIIFAETGLFLGFFLPGDSLLFVAGLVAAEGTLHVGLLLFLIVTAAILGNVVGYAFGYKVGPALFRREDSLLFKKSHVIKAHNFYEKHGSKAIMIARFMPIVRTFAPIVAGVAKMTFRSFMVYNILGAFIWVFLLVLLGYWLGNSIPNIDHYILPIVGVIIILSIMPGVIHYVKARNENKKVAASAEIEDVLEKE
jgi:membrane-associated protein